MRYEGGMGWVKNSLRLTSDKTERVTYKVDGADSDC